MPPGYPGFGTSCLSGIGNALQRRRRTKSNLKYRYIIEGSDDEEEWVILADKSENNNDRSHDYIKLEAKVDFRYLRIKNIEVPDGSFAISGFRVFGLGRGEKPAAVDSLNVVRNAEDKRDVTLTWNEVENAIGYNILYGVAQDKLYHTYQVMRDTAVTIRSLNAEQDYFFSIEAFNENGTSAQKQGNE